MLGCVFQIADRLVYLSHTAESAIPRADAQIYHVVVTPDILKFKSDIHEIPPIPKSISGQPDLAKVRELVDSGLGCGGFDADVAAVASAIGELHDASDESEERVVLALTDVFAGLVARAALAHENRARVNELAAEALYAEPLSVRIAAVCRGAAAFLVCHDEFPF